MPSEGLIKNVNMTNVTIREIAQILNLSKATVSRAFNDKYDIKEETKKMILQKAKELGYQPNPIAKKLLQKRSFNIGVIVPEFTNSFFAEVARGIQDFFCPKGYQVIIMEAGENENSELDQLSFMEKNMVDGLILSLTNGCSPTTMQALKRLVEKDLPITLFNRVNEKLAVPTVVFNDFNWALFATEHLIHQGCRNIFHFSGPPSMVLSSQRIKGFQRALEKYRLDRCKGQIFETDLSIKSGEKIMGELIKMKNIPDGIFAVSDAVAIGAIKVLKRNSIRIPEDVAIVGFSDTPAAEIIDPSLTSVKQPTMELGRVAAELLFDQLTEETKTKDRKVVLSGKLIIRQSSLKQTSIK